MDRDAQLNGTPNPTSETRHVILGNGFDIQFGGQEYTNKAIIERAIENTKTAKLEEKGYNIDCAETLNLLWIFSKNIVNGEADSLKDIKIAHIGKRLERFKGQYIGSRRREIGQIGIEDYLFIMEIVFILCSIDNPDRYGYREMIKNCFLDSIFNGGKIQDIHRNYPKSLKGFLMQFENIFTTNYGYNLETFLDIKISYLHGAFHILDDLYNSDTFIGQLNKENNNPIIPKHMHLRSTAILSDNGESKAFQIESHQLTNSAIRKFMTTWNKNTQVHTDIEKWNDGIPLLFKKSIHYCAEHPGSFLHENVALEQFKFISGELHIIGLSPFNDNHIFDAINENILLKKIVYYYYQQEECSRISKTLTQKDIEYKSVKNLWQSLDLADDRGEQ